MLVKKKDKSRNKKKNLLSRLFLLLIFMSYSSVLVLITLNINNIGKKFLTLIPLGTKQIIKDSIPYQLYVSGFKVNIVNNLIKGAFQKVDPIVLDIKYKQFDKLQKNE